MKIGELSSASSTHIETIRYYEREGLLPPPARSQGNLAAAARLLGITRPQLSYRLSKIRGEES